MRFWEDVIEQAIALGRAPLSLRRGPGVEEKVLKNAYDVCANEAREIAMYTAIERLARCVGDDETAVMAASILADEEKMLGRVTRELPKLTDAVVRADLKGKPPHDSTDAGASHAIREARADVASHATAASKRAARQARKVPGVARTEGRIKVAVAPEDDLAISGYDELTAEEIAGDGDRAQQSRSDDSAENRAGLIDAAQRELANS